MSNRSLIVLGLQFEIQHAKEITLLGDPLPFDSGLDSIAYLSYESRCKIVASLPTFVSG